MEVSMRTFLLHPSSRAAASLAFLAAIVLAGCSNITTDGSTLRGSGPITTDVRSLGDFSRIEVGGGMRLAVAIGSPASVTVTAEQNLVPITRTTRTGDRLVVDTTESFSTSKGITVSVTVPRLDEVQLAGGATGEAVGVTADTLILGGAGGARLMLTGAADELRLTGQGGAVFDLTGLTASRATVDLDGGVVAKLKVTDSITGTADGGVVVRLSGNPATVNVATQGGAVVMHD